MYGEPFSMLRHMTTPLHYSLLRRYWFQTKTGFGFGVTAYSIADARELLAAVIHDRYRESEVLTITEDVDIRSLDQAHVISNMGPPNLRGVWYPLLNL
jgi:hypothetical protein